MYRKILLLFVTFLVAACGVFRKGTSYHGEYYEEVYLDREGDTIFVAGIENWKLNGGVKCRKREGVMQGGHYDIIYNDAMPFAPDWTYGFYRENKKHGEWYYLNENGKKLWSEHYKNDTLHGRFLHLNNSGLDTMRYCNYNNGLLHGACLIDNSSWKLNYNMGKLNGIQQRVFDGKIWEEMFFSNGRLISISKGENIKAELDETGTGTVKFDSLYLSGSILSTQFDHITSNGKVQDFVGDGQFSATIPYCNGYICPGEITLFFNNTALSFNVSYDVQIKRSN